VTAERRYDPDRKDRIIDATIDVIAERGVAATTHRRIAAAADVPLGSVTYHFASLRDLLRQAFERHAQAMSAGYAAHFHDVRSAEDLITALTNLVHDPGPKRDWVIGYELHLAALRDPALASVTESWMRAGRNALEQFLDPPSARLVDALLAGLGMHRELSTDPPPWEQTRDHVSRVLAGASVKEPLA
jgi:DNA-binding transcriptional regulator YbjK